MTNRMRNLVRQRQNAVSNSRRRQMRQNYFEQVKKPQSNQGSTPHYNPLNSDEK